MNLAVGPMENQPHSPKEMLTQSINYLVYWHSNLDIKAIWISSDICGDIENLEAAQDIKLISYSYFIDSGIQQLKIVSESSTYSD